MSTHSEPGRPRAGRAGLPGRTVAIAVFLGCAFIAAGIVLADRGGLEPGIAEGPDLGRPMSPEEVARWDTSVFPDGTGLPAGRGTARAGKPLYDRHCLECHGPEAMGGTADELAGGTAPLNSEHPDKNIGTYWPYATTLFDFVKRAMPMRAPRSLSNDEVYALAAYLLYRNGIIGEDDEMNAETLAAVRMPNREGFVPQWPEPHP